MSNKNILKSTAYGINPNIPPVDQRPRCSHLGCEKHVMIISTRKDGTPIYRKWCSEHHDKRTAAKHGLKNIAEVVAKNAGFSSVMEYLDAQAIAKGFKSYTDYENSKHPYRRYRKNYCENADGRLNYKCTTTIVDDYLLDVDHIDGNPSNNDPSNLQTLCACCHRVKTRMYEDYKTMGRKSLGITY